MRQRLPYYLQHQVWAAGADDPRGLGGDQIPMALSSWTLLYGYLGNPAVKANMILMADYWLAHGISKPELLWANLPYPYNTELHSGEYDGDMRAGKGFLQPDKAASFGAELVVLYRISGNRKYLDAAAHIADTLAAQANPGDAENSPWPYRVHAAIGEVHKQTAKNGKTVVASYTTNYTGGTELVHGPDRARPGLHESLRPRASPSDRLAKGLSAQDQPVGSVLRRYSHCRLFGHGNQRRHARRLCPSAPGVGPRVAGAGQGHPGLEFLDV